MVSASPLYHFGLREIVAQESGMWRDLQGARIFITGGTGFIGIWLLESILCADTELGLELDVTVLSRDPCAFAARHPHLGKDGRLSWIRGDQSDFAFPDEKFNIVVHGAVEYGNPRATFLRNLDGTRRVLDFARHAGAKRVMLLSSGAIYGPQPPLVDRLSEDSTQSPRLDSESSSYGLVKRASEHLAHIYANEAGFEVSIARLFTVIGPHVPLSKASAVGNFIRDAMKGGPIVVKGDGTPLRTYIYAGEAAAWLWLIAARGKSGRAYNVGGEDVISIIRLAELVREIVAPGAAVCVLQESAGMPPLRYVPSLARATEDLGLKIQVSLELAIRRTAQFYRTEGISLG